MRKFNIILFCLVLTLSVPSAFSQENPSPFDISITLPQKAVKQGQILEADIKVTSTMLSPDLILELNKVGIILSPIFDVFIEIIGPDGGIRHTEKRKVNIFNASVSLFFNYSTQGMEKGKYSLKVYSPFQNIDRTKLQFLPPEYSHFAQLDMISSSADFEVLRIGASIDDPQSYLINPDKPGLVRQFTVKTGQDIEGSIAIRNDDTISHTVKLSLNVCGLEDFLCQTALEDSEYELLLQKGDTKKVSIKIGVPEKEGGYLLRIRLLNSEGALFSAVTTKISAITPSISISQLRVMDDDGIILTGERGIIEVKMGSSTSSPLPGSVDNLEINIIVNDLGSKSEVFRGSKIIPRVNLDLSKVIERFEFSSDKDLKNYQICAFLGKEGVEYDRTCFSADNSDLLSDSKYDINIDFVCLTPCIDCKPCELYKTDVKVMPRDTKDSLIDSMVVLNTKTNDLLENQVMSNSASFNIGAGEKDILLIISDEDNQLKIPIESPQDSLTSKEMEEGESFVDSKNEVDIRGPRMERKVDPEEVESMHKDIVLPYGDFVLPLSTKLVITKTGEIRFYDRDGKVKEPTKIEADKCYTRLSFEGKTVITLFPDSIVLTEFREGSKSITLYGETKTVLYDSFEGGDYIFTLLEGEQLVVSASCDIDIVERSAPEEAQTASLSYKFYIFIAFDILLVIVFILLIIHHQRVVQRGKKEERPAAVQPQQEEESKEEEPPQKPLPKMPQGDYEKDIVEIESEKVAERISRQEGEVKDEK